MNQTCSDNDRSDKEAIFNMVTIVFDNATHHERLLQLTPGEQ